MISDKTLRTACSILGWFYEDVPHQNYDIVHVSISTDLLYLQTTEKALYAIMSSRLIEQVDALEGPVLVIGPEECLIEQDDPAERYGYRTIAQQDEGDTRDENSINAIVESKILRTE